MDYRLNEVLSQFGGEQEGNQIRIPCPVHHGKDNNCAVWIDDRNNVAAHCHSHGCAVNDFLYDNVDCLKKKKRGPISKEDKNNAIWLKDEEAEIFEPPREWPTRTKEYRYTKQWWYTSPDGVPINFVVVRYDHPTKNKKQTIPFIYARLTDGRKQWIAKGPKQPQWYNLHRIEAAETVVFVEGEKCAAHITQKFGSRVAGISWSGGAKRVADVSVKDIIPLIKDKQIILWPDNDDPGHDAMWRGTINLYDRLHGLGVIAALVDTSDAQASTDCADIESIDGLTHCLKNTISPDNLKFEEIYARCELSRLMNLGEEQLRTIPCGMGEVCKQCRYHYMQCGSPIDVLNIGPVESSFAIIASEKRYIKIDNPSVVYDDQALTMMYAHLPGYSSTGANAPHNVMKNSTVLMKCERRDFLPGKPLKHDNVFNLWKPIVWDRSNHDASTWVEIGRNWASEHELKIILQHMAFTLRHPETKINWQIIVRGDTGIGKSLFLSTFFKIFQRHRQFCTITDDMLNGGFNGEIIGAKVASIEEMMSARGGYSVENRLKNYCAAPPDTIPINVKFGSQFHIANVLSLYVQTNNEVPFKISDNDRRWFVIDCDLNDAKKLHTVMSTERIQEVLQDGYEDRICEYLSSIDLFDFKPGDNAPTSAGRELIIKSSLPYYRDIAPELLENDWHEIVQLSDVQDFVQKRLKITVNRRAMGNVMRAVGWHNCETQIKLSDGTGIRPWITDKRRKYYQDEATLLRPLVKNQWEKQHYRSIKPGKLIDIDDYR